MLNVQERIESYSDRDLAAMRARVNKQSGKLFLKFARNAFSAGPVLNSFMEVLTGKSVDKLGIATKQDFANMREIDVLERRMNMLNLLGRRMDLAADRRRLMRVTA